MTIGQMMTTYFLVLKYNAKISYNGYYITVNSPSLGPYAYKVIE